MNENTFEQGLSLLRQPVAPLVSMVQFLYLTGPFATVAEVIGEMPEPIETELAAYEHPVALLREYLEHLQPLESLKSEQETGSDVVDEQGEPVDRMTAVSALVMQQVLTTELEKINSRLCGQCNCTLCCTGPSEDMSQEFFEIPLAPREIDLFAVDRCDHAGSRAHRARDEEELYCDGQPFYRRQSPGLFHWQNGWSLILPRGARCPNLEPGSGRCRVYAQRPEVCRRPQIFPYMLERLDEPRADSPTYRLRQTLLAVVDCPYVRELQDDIARYAAAAELHLAWKENKS
ncbi:hypothetical protein MNBD_DELTA04-369 [hydrothermal vent metagenome]|uniref:YkgJ family cysteine cluster protein n=1 Tax=hydrothermal vent metagenome TaxID=652676 RepID=A0A3B0V1F1_9ZZZZ